jgi:predicted AlkP superfamily phosphohydrolase/phosphomutase
MFSFSKKQKAEDRKAVIIGLDGVPCSLLTEYMGKGIMPRFSDIASSGKLLPMKSTLPEVSSVAWSSFMTGKNPAGHGIFGFMETDRNTYDYQFPNYNSLKAPTFWETLDMPATVFNIPQTYPARPMNGVLVSGFVALDLEKAVYPKKVCDYLKQTGYRLDVQSALAAKDPEAFFEDLFYTFNKRIEAIQYLYDQKDWKLFIGTITETDRLHHFFFDSARSGKHHDIFVKFYRKLDEFLAVVFKKAEDDQALFLTCSDHGFTEIETEIYVNRYLMENGFLKLSGGEGLIGITSDSRAFCLDPARVYIHQNNRYSRGCVNTADYERVRTDIKGLFESLRFNNKKAIKKVYFKEEIFDGPYLDDAPDIYVLGEPGFDLKSPVNRDSTFGLSFFRGAHTYEDAHMFISDPDISTDVDFSITDIEEIISGYMKKE